MLHSIRKFENKNPKFGMSKLGWSCTVAPGGTFQNVNRLASAKL